MLEVILILVSILCVGLVSLFYYDIKYYIVSRRIKKTERTKSQVREGIDAFKKELISASMRIVSTGKKIEYPVLYSDNLIARFRLNRQDEYATNRFDYAGPECGWLVYALVQEDLEFVKKIFDEKALKLEIQAISPAEYGMIAVYLYKKYRDDRYKEYCDTVYKYLLELNTDCGLAYCIAHKDELILVDTLGIAVPFLIEYGNYFKVTRAIELAEKTLDCYLQYGCDSSTGIPAFSYKAQTPHIKCGASNWGRGCAWLVIGLLYINIEYLDAKSQKVVKTLESTLTSLWKDQGLFGHFIGDWTRDLSAELPIVYYLYKMNLISLDDRQILEYSTMCHDGIMYNCSSSNVGIVKHGFPYGPNMLGQGYMLRLIQLYEERNAK